MIVLLLPVLPLSLPVLSYPNMIRYDAAISEMGAKSPLRWEDGTIHSLPQDYADMTGWKELADIVDSTWYSLSPKEQKRTVIYAENYGEAGAINYFNRKRNLPASVSFDDSFLFWVPDSVLSTTLTLIYINNDTSGIRKQFREVTLAGKVTNPYARNHGVQVYLCRNPIQEFSTFYADKVKSLKAAY